MPHPWPFTGGPLLLRKPNGGVPAAKGSQLVVCWLAQFPPRPPLKVGTAMPPLPKRCLVLVPPLAIMVLGEPRYALAQFETRGSFLANHGPHSIAATSTTTAISISR